MVVGRSNKVVVFMGFSNMKMSELLFGPTKVVVSTEWLYGGVPRYCCH